MKIDIRFDFSKEGSEFSAAIVFKDLDKNDIDGLLDRSEKPLTDKVGAILYSESPLAALEVMCMYLSKISGGNPGEILKTLRKSVYTGAAINSAINQAPSDQREDLKNQFFDVLQEKMNEIKDRNS